ncbi:hypothetical protein SAMN02746066_03195 [Anaerosporobacter mobilis DSM 15930]|jgi:hypothetical protein|uniref:Uncharacterized protein n=1 Tax=Anaerosporobacter mobilis DSM 15930 TaxID=1120996 RepID=A0A1M7LD57_9FIRM|nr:hypothetical protein SAMN02746066_03195 [Anaerosporobacter mobilis DSM 15930]
MEFLKCILILCPGILASELYRIMKKEKFSWFKTVKTTVIFMYIITFFNFIILYARGWGAFNFDVLTIQFIIKYIITSIILAIISPLLVVWVEFYKKKKIRV